MTLLCIISAVVALALFALSTDQHHQQRLGTRPTAERKREFKRMAWAAVILCLILAFAAKGAIFGAIFWLGSLSFGAGGIFLFLNLMPESITAAPAVTSKQNARQARNA